MTFRCDTGGIDAQAIMQEAMVLRPLSRPGDPGGRTLTSSEAARTLDRGDGDRTPGDETLEHSR